MPDTVSTVSIGGDISPFESEIGRMPGLAADAGAAVNSAFANSGTVDALAAAVQNVAGQMGALAPLARNVSDAYAAYVQATRDAESGTLTSEAAMRRQSEALDELQRSIIAYNVAAETAAKQTEQLGKTLNDMSSAALKIGADLTAIAAPLAALGLKSLEVSGYFEQATISFTTLLHSGEAAKKMIADLTEFSLRTPFEIKGLVDVSRQLIGMGTSADDLIPRLRTLGDAAAALGLGESGVKRLALAFGEMQTRGSLAMKEVNQLAMAGIPAMEILAKALDTTVAGVMDRVHKRTIDSATAIPILLAGLNDRFGGMMEKQAGTYEGLLSNLKDALTKTFKQIGDEILPSAKAIIEALYPVLNAVGEMAKVFGSLPAPVKEFALIVGTVAVATGPFVLALAGVLKVAADFQIALPLLQAGLGRLGIEFGTGAAAAETFAGAESTVASRAATATGAIAAESVATQVLAREMQATAVQLDLFGAGATRTAVQMELLAGVEGSAVIAAESTAVAHTGLASAVNTASTALSGLLPMLTIGAYVVLAEKVYELGKAYIKLREAQAGLEDAGRNESDALAKLEIEMRRQGINISDLSDKYHGGLISIDEYRKGLAALAVAFRAANPYVESAADAHNRLAGEIAKASAKIAEAQGQANETLKIAAAVLEEYKKKVADGTASQAELTRAQQAYDKALKDTEPTIKAARGSIAELMQKHLDAARAFDTSRSAFTAAMQSMVAGKASVDVVAQAYDDAQKKAKAAGTSFYDAGAEMAKAGKIAGEHITDLKALADVYLKVKGSSDDSIGSQQALADLWKRLTDAAKALGIELTNVGGVFQAQIADKAGKASAGVKALAEATQEQLNAGSDGIIVNGKYTLTLEQISQNSRDAANASLAASDGANEYQASLDDLTTTMVYQNGELTTAADLLKSLSAGYEDAAKAAYDAASAVNTLADEIRAEDSAAASAASRPTGGKGGRGGGSGGTSAQTWLENLISLASSPLASVGGNFTGGMLSNMVGALNEMLGVPGNTIGGGGASSNGGGIGPGPLRTASEATATAVSSLGSAADHGGQYITYLGTTADKASLDLTKLANGGADATYQLEINLPDGIKRVVQAITKNADAVQNLDLSGVTSEMQSLVTAGSAAADGLTGLAGAVDPLANTVKAIAATAQLSMQAMAADVAVVLGSQKTAQTNTPATSQGLPPISVSTTIQAGVVAGQNGMQQLSGMVADNVITQLKQVTGLKTF